MQAKKHQFDAALEKAMKSTVRTVDNAYPKRLFDVVFSALFLLLGATWLFPVIAVLIKISDGGPVFYIQKRYGYQGRPFNCIKFRTMRPCLQNEFRQATLGDVRITRLGLLLRKSNIDELPQFINVFLGQMSVVGPRPHALEMDHQFHADVPLLFARYQVKPGLTGLAQVRGHRGETPTSRHMANRVRLDVFYVTKACLILDLKIIAKTVLFTINGDPKAY